LHPCRCAAAEESPADRVSIGFYPAGESARAEGIRQALRERGYIEGQNIAIEYRSAEQKRERLPELAAELVRLRVDLIMVTGGPPALAAKKATSTIPIVITTSADPVGEGLVSSLARPGGNVTGLSSLSPELNTKTLEILKDAVPKLARVGILRSAPPNTVATDLQLKELRAAAVALKLKLEEIDTQLDLKGLENAFQTAKQTQVNAIMTVQTRNFFGERKRIVEIAGKYRLPAIYFQKEFVDEGGLMSYGADFDDMFRRSAHYVDKILKGAKPADLPVQQATKFEFVINLKAAKQIGLTLSPGVSFAGESGNQITFWIFGFSIESQENKAMNAFSSKSLSDNRKSAIQNRNLAGFSVIAFALVAAVAVAQAQQPKKVLADRVSITDRSGH
jgi:putative tryptophan/tyrosine transport system substrate-binding protein